MKCKNQMLELKNTTVRAFVNSLITSKLSIFKFMQTKVRLSEVLGLHKITEEK